MLKNILNLEGAQQISNNEQKTITGGLPYYCVQKIHLGGGCDAVMDQATCDSNGGFYDSICRCCDL